jgi:hypothetical protein
MTETPEYIVLKKQNNFEIRKYPEMIKAEVQVAETDYKSAAEKGFRILAGYIFGNNTSREKVEMTTPVHVASSQQIAMTTPVTITRGDKFTVAFIMPTVYTIETLPIPGDQSIRFNVVPEQQMSAIRFSGYFKRKRSRSIKNFCVSGSISWISKRKVISSSPAIIHPGCQDFFPETRF